MSRDTTPLQRKKDPTQDRSRALVEAIETAARQVLLAEGWAGFTIELVCSRAGVSPGSLYQYFPGKNALGYALLRRHAEEVTSSMAAVLSEHADAPVETIVGGAVDAFVDAHLPDPGVHSALGEMVAQQAGPGLESDLLQTGSQLLEQILTRREDELDGQDPALLAFLLVRCLEGAVHSAARDQPEMLGREDFRTALKTMMIALF